jgi:hypothetical protein
VNARQIAQIGIGLIGIYVLASAVQLFASYLGMAGRAGGAPIGSTVMFIGIPLALLLGFSYVLVFHNAQFAKAIVPDSDATITGDGTDLARVAFALLGVMLLSDGIPSLINHVLSFVASASQEYSNPGERLAITRSVVGVAAKVAIGWYVIARPKRLLDAVRRPME